MHELNTVICGQNLIPFPTQLTELPAADESQSTCPSATRMRLDTTADGANDSPSELRDGGFRRATRPSRASRVAVSPAPRRNFGG